MQPTDPPAEAREVAEEIHKSSIDECQCEVGGGRCRSCRERVEQTEHRLLAYAERVMGRAQECSGQDYGDGTGLGPDGVVYAGDRAHCLRCRAEAAEAEASRLREELEKEKRERQRWEDRWANENADVAAKTADVAMYRAQLSEAQADLSLRSQLSEARAELETAKSSGEIRLNKMRQLQGDLAEAQQRVETLEKAIRDALEVDRSSSRLPALQMLADIPRVSNEILRILRAALSEEPKPPDRPEASTPRVLGGADTALARAAEGLEQDYQASTRVPDAD